MYLMMPICNLQAKVQDRKVPSSNASRENLIYDKAEEKRSPSFSDFPHILDTSVFLNKDICKAVLKGKFFSLAKDIARLGLAEMAQHIKTHAAETDHLSSILGTHMVGENQFLQAVVCSPHTPTHS